MLLALVALLALFCHFAFAAITPGGHASLSVTVAEGANVDMMAAYRVGPSFSEVLPWTLVQNPSTDGSDFSGCAISARPVRSSFVFLALSTCPISIALNNAKAQGFRGVLFMLISDVQPSVFPETSDLIVMTVSKQAGMRLIDAQLTAAVPLSVRAYELDPFDASGLALLGLALLGFIASAFYGAHRERQVYSLYKSGLSGVAGSDEDGPATQGAVDAGQDTAVALSLLAVLGYLALSAASFLLLFFVPALAPAAAAGFATVAALSLYSLLVAAAKALGLRERLAAPGVTLGDTPVGLLTLALAAAAVAAAATWLLLCALPGAWIAQVLLGLAVLLCAQRFVKVSSLRAAALVLVAAAALDVFWVYGAPAALGAPVFARLSATDAAAADNAAAPAAAVLPALLRLPRAAALSDPAGGMWTWAVLALGDVAVPALLATLLLKRDYLAGAGALRGFFPVAVVGYVLGLVAAAGAALATQQPQAPLAFVAPAVLLSVALAGVARGQLRALWAGVGEQARRDGAAAVAARKGGKLGRGTQLDTGDVEMAGAYGQLDPRDGELDMDNDPDDGFMHVVGLRPDEL